MAAIFVYIGVNLEPGLGSSPIRWRHLMQTLNIGRNLKWQCRGIAQEIGKAVQATKGHLLEMMAWSGLQRISKLQLTQREHYGGNHHYPYLFKRRKWLEWSNHDRFCGHKIIVALRSNPHRRTGRIAGNLNLIRHGNPQPSQENSIKVSWKVQRLGVELAEVIRLQKPPASFGMVI